MKNGFLIVAMLGLSACDLPALDLPFPSFGASKGQSEITVTRDDVTLAGPRGFCVDPQTTTSGTSSAFVVFGNCAAITDTRNAPQPEHNSIVTVTVRLADPTLPRIESSQSELARFFDSDSGQTLLSRSSDPSKVSVKESGTTRDGAFFMYVTDQSAGAPEGTEDTYWRALLDAKNSVVTVSVLSLDANPLTRGEGLSILRDFTSVIQSAVGTNQSIDPSLETTRPIERPTTPGTAEPQKTRKGILGRLFG